MWHRYLFPVGCFLYEKPDLCHEGWKEWARGMKVTRDQQALINPYSVMMNDVEHLVQNKE